MEFKIIKKLIKFLNYFEEYILGFTTLFLAIYIFLAAVLRDVLGFGFSWGQELITYLFIAVTFFGASLGVKYGSHFTFDLLYKYVSGKSARVLVSLTHLSCFLFFLAIIYYGFIHCVRLKQFGTLTPATQIPMYVPFLSIPLSSILISFRFLINFIKQVKLLF
jgi:C4-dicarboxylate transporter DctQ subunit